MIIKLGTNKASTYVYASVTRFCFFFKLNLVEVGIINRAGILDAKNF